MFGFLSEKFSSVLGWLKNKSHLTQDNIEEAVKQVRDALLEADVPYGVIEDFLSQVKQEAVGLKIHQALNPGQQFIKVVHDKVLEFLGGRQSFASVSLPIPAVVLVMGLQGSGKTTTTAKLAYWFKQQAEKRKKSRRILLCSVDFYRPAALEQLKILSAQVGVDYYGTRELKNPIAAAREACAYFKDGGYEYLLLDTAGRLHVDTAMMDELKEVNRLVNPKYKFLVLDAMTGQESLSVATTFNTAVGFDAAILTKMDSDTRGGAAFAFRYQLKRPIFFVGVGEKLDDFEEFIPERMASRMIGMGDMMTLIEKATEVMDDSQHQGLEKNFLSGKFSLDDFAEQMALIQNMGSLQKIVRYLPGMGGLSPDDFHKGEQEMKKFRAIISSMNKKERLLPTLLDGSRKKRIAMGAGVRVEDVNILLQRFEQSRQFAKILKKGGIMKGLFK